ncbi:DUF402 domain-containing protein [Tepidiforma flava]|uniref:DUF402 domain-containing protein n=1 Tax=Tepidiforma flava TaxID=3004094 RepID=A0ABY7M505_9CHLR|nr:DUF402 domain-containing protein [Tepidiforma flava]WBL35615.1 DUF402 domain-containing protein [Tepidiforma flava]
MRRFEPGETVALRYITRADSTVGMTWPARVVRDDDELVALWIPEGAEYRAWHRPPGEPRRLGPARWRRETLRLMFPGRAHSTWCSWEGPDRAFRMYYVNFEEPFRRTPIGFDTNDHALDIVVWPDFRWEWKDLDEFEALAAQGVFTEPFAAAVRAEAAAVLAELERRSGVFAGEWPRWRPPAGWSVPGLPAGWSEVPPEPWELRTWAYRPHLAPR